MQSGRVGLGDTPGQVAPSDTFGMVTDRSSHKWHVSNKTREFSSLVKFINMYFKQLLAAAGREDFAWSSFTLNKDLQCRRHRDRNNAGPSAIISAGPHRGGNLLYWEGDDRSASVGDLNPADAAKLRVQKKLQFFDGRKAHDTAPFQGPRVTIVWYVYGGAEEAPKELIEEARSLGFGIAEDGSTLAMSAQASGAADLDTQSAVGGPQLSAAAAVFRPAGSAESQAGGEGPGKPLNLVQSFEKSAVAAVGDGVTIADGGDVFQQGRLSAQPWPLQLSLSTPAAWGPLNQGTGTTLS